MDFISVCGLRGDGRRPQELRRLRCRLGLLPFSDGSAQLEQGNTSVLASVAGPREPTQRSDLQLDRCTISVDLSFAAFATGEKRRGPRRDRRATEWSLQLRRLLEAVVLTELLPRSALHIAVTVLCADGGARAAAANAALLALADAGVPLRDTCAAASVTLLEGQAVLDPSRAEEGRGPELLLALLPASATLPLLLHDGARCPLEQLGELVGVAQTGAAAVSEWMKAVLLTRAQEKLAALP